MEFSEGQLFDFGCPLAQRMPMGWITTSSPSLTQLKT
jgi:hypothetical protein